MENILRKGLISGLPLKSEEQLKAELSAPLPKEAIKSHPTKTYLSSIKAIYVTERLNEVFGIGQWTLKTHEIERGNKGMVVIKSILEVPDYGFYYESYGGNDNGGDGSKNFDLGDAYKGATTDGITKICSYLGIGIEVFKGLVTAPPAANDLPWLNEKDTANWLESVNILKGGGTIADVEAKYKVSKDAKAKLALIPKTLTAPDFILTPELIEEYKKAIKLITQATGLTGYYNALNPVAQQNEEIIQALKDQRTSLKK